jgi:hypothetical protein
MGVCLVLIIGVLIIALDMGLGPTVAWWRRRKYRKHQVQDTEGASEGDVGHPLHSTLEWSQMSVLQLQRLAHESVGYRDWSNCDKTVPVTERGQLLACLEYSNLKHPLLQGSGAWSVMSPKEQSTLHEGQSVEEADNVIGTVERQSEAENRSNSINSFDRYTRSFDR